MNHTIMDNEPGEPNYLPHQSYLKTNYTTDCGYVMQLPYEERCAFILETAECRAMIGSIDHLLGLFCQGGGGGHLKNWKFLVFKVWCAFLVKLLVCNARQNIVPMFLVCVKMLGVTSHMAGITVLVLAKGLSDIFPPFWAYTGPTTLLINQHMGCALFTTAFIGGIVILRRPFVWKPLLLLNDLCWYAVTIVWLAIIFHSDNVYLYEAGICIVICAMYLGSSVLVQTLGDSDMEILRPGEAEELQKAREARKHIHFEEEETIEPVTTEPAPVLCDNLLHRQSIWRDFVCQFKLRAVSQDWHKVGWIRKFWLACLVPSNVFIMLLIPVVDYDLPNLGWCKLMFICNVILFPQYVLRALFKDPQSQTIIHQYFFDVRMIVWILLVLSFVAAALILWQCDVNRPNKHYERVAFGGLIASSLLAYVVVSELVACLSAFFSVLGVSQQMIGLSVLSWANCIGDFVTLMELTRRGYHECAHAATIAGPIFYSIVGIGSIFWLRNNSLGDRGTVARQGTMGGTTVTFILIVILHKIAMAAMLKYQARRIVGIFLITYYCFYMLFAIGAESFILHGYGSDHSGPI